MNANVGSAQTYQMDQEEMKYWARRGTKTAAFLLVIPGCALIGVGIGMAMAQIVPASVIGFGAGLLVWGLVVALTK